MYGMRAQDTAPATHFRSDRLCRVNGQLYFSTREDTLEGPFKTRYEAYVAIQMYIVRMDVQRSIGKTAKPARTRME